MANPLQVKLHSAKKAMSNVDSQIMRADKEKQNEMATKHKETVEKRQEAIDHYNLTTCKEIDPAFDNIQLSGRDMIVRLHKENFIKSISFYADDTPLYDAWISKVDGRMNKTMNADWVENPLPYVFTGTVVAMSPKLEYELEEDFQALQEKGLKNFKKLETGDVVHLNHFMYADRQFYLNKQNIDFIRNPKEFRIEHWEGYVKINFSLIQALVRDNEQFYSEMSPYQDYLKALEANKKEEGYVTLDELNEPVTIMSPIYEAPTNE